MAISARSAIELRCCTIVNKPFMNGQDARSPRKSTLCGTGILPVLENGARCAIEPIIAKGRSTLQSSSATSKAMP
ncbi:hypothetical protein QUB47_35410 [Microcoleus sp. AT9_B5]